MAFNIGKANPFSGNGGYGLGDYGGLHPQGSGRIINSYAQVTNITASTPDNFNKVTIGATYLTTIEKWPAPFATNTEVLVHVAAINKSGVAEDVRRGRWQVCRITGRSSTTTSNGLVLTLNKNLKKVFLDSGNGFEGLYIQLVSIPNFKDVILDSGCSITCPVFSAGNGYGGVVAFKSSGTLTFSGGHIDVAEKGIQSSDATALWSNSRVPKEDCTNDIVYRYVGWENYRAVYHLPLNYPGGVVFALAKNMVCHADSRIGNPSQTGVARERGANNNLAGGSSILLAAENISGWTPAMLAKYPTSKNSNYRGLNRCYVATETTLPTDEGLYALDCISDTTRMAETFNLSDIQFGSGKDGDRTNYTDQLNSYAAVTNVKSNNQFDIDVNNIKNSGLATLEAGALVLIHASPKSTWYKETGRCMFSKITNYANGVITIEDEFLGIDGASLETKHYYIQIIAVPQFNNFTLTTVTHPAPAFSNGCGGIAAIAVSGNCNLSGGKILVEKCGISAKAYGSSGLNYVGNAQMSKRLPLGQGHGSVLILAKNLTMNTDTRIGSSFTGNNLNGLNYRLSNKDGTEVTAGQPWSAGTIFDEYVMGGSKNGFGEAGGGDRGGKIYGYNTGAGGYGSNSATSSTKTDVGYQGAHVLIIADKITGFCIDAISTGGSGGNTYTYNLAKSVGIQGSAGCGGASYGGAGASFNQKFRGGNGGFIGGGAGSSNDEDYTAGGGAGGFAFVYCNEISKQNTNGISLER